MFGRFASRVISAAPRFQSLRAPAFVRPAVPRAVLLSSSAVVASAAAAPASKPAAKPAKAAAPADEPELTADEKRAEDLKTKGIDITDSELKDFVAHVNCSFCTSIAQGPCAKLAMEFLRQSELWSAAGGVPEPNKRPPLAVIRAAQAMETCRQNTAWYPTLMEDISQNEAKDIAIPPPDPAPAPTPAPAPAKKASSPPPPAAKKA